MKRLEAVLVDGHDHIRPRPGHLERFGDHERRRREHHVAGHNGHIGVAGTAKGRVKARQRATLVDDVGLETDAQFGILLLQKRKLFRLVGGDDELVGHRREPLDQTADERSAAERDRGLAAAHTAALAAGLDDHRHARAREARLKKIREPSHIVDIERRNTVHAGGFSSQRDVGDHRDRCGRGHLVGDVDMVGIAARETILLGLA